MMVNSEATPFYEAGLIFPPEHWHNHSSSIVECPDGSLLVCWYHGSGEREADDVRVLGARKPGASGDWSPPFLLADTPGFPDTNPVLTVDGQGRLWLFYGTQLDNQWESTLLKYKVAHDLGHEDRPPEWETEGVLHLKPDDEAFAWTVQEYLDAAWRPALEAAPPERRAELTRHLARLHARAGDKLSRRLGWMERCHPLFIGKQMLLPLYSDGFEFSLMAFTDDGGATWTCGRPLVGPGAIQPSVVRKRDGTLVAYLRNNGPAPARILTSESSDSGRAWSPARYIDLPNPGASVEALVLQDGRWLLCYNDAEAGRRSLAVALSDDEGRAWRWTRHLERETGDEAGAFHYPSVIEARDGMIHITYTFTLGKRDLPPDRDGLPAREAIKHARFNPAWVLAGD